MSNPIELNIEEYQDDKTVTFDNNKLVDNTNILDKIQVHEHYKNISSFYY